MTNQEKIRGRKIGIIGMARSGVAAAALVHRNGGRAFVSDIRPEDRLVPEAKLLKELGVAFETGRHGDRLLESDFIILSPGVPPTADIVRTIVDRGIPVFSEIELASWFCRGNIIGITGSNGKTTTTTLTGAILSRAGISCEVCGNIGRPFSAVVENINSDGYAVVEVSSFQLEMIEQFRPHIAMILNLTPDHLDRYDGFAAYKAAKYRIAENQSGSDYLILNADDPELMNDTVTSNSEIVHLSTHRSLPTGVFKRGATLVGRTGGKEESIIDIGDIIIPGPHNLQNAAAASLAALLAGVGPADIASALRAFKGVEHRLENAGTVAGIRFINDSKATNVDSVVYALRSVSPPICLIAGGRDKGGDFAPIIKEGRGKIKEIILIGEAREKMFEALGRTFSTQFADSLEEAVAMAFEAASPGDTVLLSPACASFDMFDNFEHRGEVF
jgi:UDP-N-acetylmuramoylalanine--D-glutamate ligase